MLADDERIKMFGPRGNELHRTMERYSGSSIGMDHYKSMDGLGIDRRYQMPDKY